jgi:single-strand DNA-binding protein
MAGINKVILVGNLGKDPEVRTISNGALVATFSIATSETFTNKDGQKVDKTEWHNLVLWRGLASVAEKYLKKGNKVYIEGKLRYRQYDDKDGNKKYITEIEATELMLLDKPANAGGGGGNSQGNNTSSYSNTNTYNDPAPQNNFGGGNSNNSDIPDDLPF